ncbi:MAG: hypothetical protein V9E91_09015 [Burkholderiaceae bacterium]|jgi:iron-sulfur cluster repair protein YtfE (RIC family)|nr:hypothetical protein [Shewanella sp.]MBP9830716.1 hypothetical protein [Polaromonas sp.]
MNTTQHCLSILNDLKNASLRIRNNASTAIFSAYDLTKLFAKLTDADRMIIQNVIDTKLSRKLLSLSGYFAEYAVNEKDAQWIKAALILHIIENFKFDPRENIRELVLIKFSAKKIDADIDDIIASITFLESNTAPISISQYMSKLETSNTLSDFGIMESLVDGKFIYAPIN